jgi:hypothetical protein
VRRAARCHLAAHRQRRRAARAVGDPQQQRDDHPVGEQRRAALGHERQRQTGQRDDPRDAAHDDEDLQRHDEREAAGEQLAEPVPDGQGGAQAPVHDEQVDQQQREQARQAELLADRGVDEVRVRERDAVRVALAPAGAEQPAGPEREQSLDDLEGAAHRVVQLGVERPQPDGHAGVDVREQVRRGDRPGREQQHAQEHPAHALGGEVEHGDEQTEEQQRGTEVALEHEDRERRAPDDEDRPQVAQARQVQADDLLARERERVAVGHEVAGEEHGERDLRELGRLHRHAGDAHPDARAVDLPADHRQERQQHEHEAEGHGGVREPAQPAVVAQEPQHRERDHGAEHRVDGVRRRVRAGHVPGAGQLEPQDRRQAEPVEQHDGRQQHLVRPRRTDPQHHVPDERDAREHAAGRPEALGERSRDRAADHRERPDPGRQGQDQEEQLGEPGGPALARLDRGVVGVAHQAPPAGGALGVGLGVGLGLGDGDGVDSGPAWAISRSARAEASSRDPARIVPSSWFVQ